MYKIPISGGPHTGKTTLVDALHKEFPDAFFLPEPATVIIEHELERQAKDSAHIPNVPWIDYPKFSRTASDKSVELEAGIPPDAHLVFQDRSQIDNIGYARLNDTAGADGESGLVPLFRERIAAANYTLALVCEPVGTYTMTDIRRETEEEALRTHDFLRAAYADSGVQVISLPPVSVAARLAIVHEVVAELD